MLGPPKQRRKIGNSPVQEKAQDIPFRQIGATSSSAQLALSCRPWHPRTLSRPAQSARLSCFASYQERCKSPLPCIYFEFQSDDQWLSAGNRLVQHVRLSCTAPAEQNSSVRAAAVGAGHSSWPKGAQARVAPATASALARFPVVGGHMGSSEFRISCRMAIGHHTPTFDHG